MPIDYSRYPINWKSEIVPRILVRDKNACKRCGIANGAVAESIPLKIYDKGRYKIKRIWLTSSSDIKRLSPFAMGGIIKTITVVLTIAHLDHDETNHDVGDDRLEAMCQYAEAKLAYHRLRKTSHPDHGGDDGSFARISLAWEQAQLDLKS